MTLNPVICLVLAICASASLALVLRLFSDTENNRYTIILGNYLTCVLTGFLLLNEKSMIFKAHPSAYICGLCAGVLFVLSLVCMQTGIQRNGAILTSAFSKLGLLVPLVLSILLFHETPGILQASGLLIVIPAVWFFSRSENDAEQAADFSLPLLFAVLITNGMSDSMAKIYSVYGVMNEEAVYFFILFLCASLITLCLLIHESRKNHKKISLRDLYAGILAGIPNYFSSYLLLKALNGIPSFIVYPVFSSGTILTVTVISMIFFAEKLSAKQLAGLGMIIAAIVLLNLS